jgi:hypothetical protein
MHEELRQTRDPLRGFHKYDIWSPCEGTCDVDALRYQLSVQPAPGNRIGDQTDIPVLGRVRHYEWVDGVQNVTVEGEHRLAPGLVTRTIETRNGVFGISTYGMGWGILPAANEAAAKVLWQSQDRQIFQRAKTCGATKC